jgi:hypothetical protein
VGGGRAGAPPQIDEERHLEAVPVERLLAARAEAPRTAVDDRAAVEHDALVAQRVRAVDVVGREQQPHAVAGERPQYRFEIATRSRIEAHERLVEQQHTRSHGQHSGQRETALLAAG